MPKWREKARLDAAEEPAGNNLPLGKCTLFSRFDSDDPVV